MKSLSYSTISNVILKSGELQQLSRRQALAGLGFTLASASFAAPAFSQMKKQSDEGKSVLHARNKGLVANFLNAMASSDRTAALR